MNFKLEIPEGSIIVNRSDLKKALQELMVEEVKGINEKEEIMTIREAAEFMKVSVPTVRNMIAKNEIPYFQRGQVIRLNRWEIKDWMKGVEN